MTEPRPYPPYVTEEEIQRVVKMGLEEDLGTGDVTSQGTVSPHAAARGRFVSKDDGIVAGLAVAEAVFRDLDSGTSFDWHVGDGDVVEAGQELGVIIGPARVILAGERLALNLMQRMSGIASKTHRMQESIRDTGTILLDTRKTAPGLRALDKWAVRLGGGANHRVGLFDMVLIKENHIRAAGSLKAAVEGAKSLVSISEPRLQIEVEVTSAEELDELLDLDGVQRVMLDNFARFGSDGRLDTSLLANAVKRVGDRLETEASGNVTEETVRAIAETGVDYISCGALTHSVTALDISLLFDIAASPSDG